MRLGRQMFLTSRFSVAFWLTPQWHLLGQMGQTPAECTDHRFARRSTPTSLPFFFRPNSQCLRLAIHLRLTAAAPEPRGRIAVEHATRFRSSCKRIGASLSNQGHHWMKHYRPDAVTVTGAPAVI